jgi:hypothetical protein
MKAKRSFKPKPLGMRFLLVVTFLILFVGIGLMIALVAYATVKGRPTSSMTLNLESVLTLVGFFLVMAFLVTMIVFFIKLTANPKPLPSRDGTAPLTEKKRTPGESRFYMLTKIDKDCAPYRKIDTEPISLKDLCSDFRAYAAANLGLYYSIDDIRRFITSLTVSHLLLLQGMSGTGKTSLPYAFGRYMNQLATVVPIQPMWKERTDLLGYYNEFTGRFSETPLLEQLYRASYSDQLYVVVLDEMNIARVEYYFAEFLSLLELPDPKSRYLDVIADERPDDPALLKGGRMQLPNNVWFVGTANNDDSTFAISDKVYDRAMVMNLDTRAEAFPESKRAERAISSTMLEELAFDARKQYGLTFRDLRRVKKLDSYLASRFHISFGNRILRQIKLYLPVYVACGGEELEALDDLLAKKVLRKLEAQNPVYVRSESEGLISYINDLFGEGKMPLCLAYIERLKLNA